MTELVCKRASTSLAWGIYMLERQLRFSEAPEESANNSFITFSVKKGESTMSTNFAFDRWWEE